MPGPRPILTTHILAMGYDNGGLHHTQHLYVNAQSSLDSTGFDLLLDEVNTIGMSSAISEWQAKTGPVLGLGTTAGGYTLYEITGTGLVPVTSGSFSFTSVGGGLTVASETTIFFKDGANRPFKVVLLEVNNPVPQHSRSYASGDVGAAMNSLVADYLNEVSGHIGFWAKSRSALVQLRFVSITTALNRRVRRRRGLA